MKLTPFCLKSFAVTTFTEREHQAIELVDHTHLRIEMEGIEYSAGQPAGHRHGSGLKG